MKIEVLNEYENSHHYIETYCKCDYFCPLCGRQQVWEGDSPDYYQGVNYYCTECESSFTLPSAGKCTSFNELGILKQLKELKAWKPKTNKGG